MTLDVALREAARTAGVTSLTQPEDPLFSICTLVTKPGEYAVMRRSFRQHGFKDVDCEYLIVDNSTSNIADAYQAINQFLIAARAPYIIICHQDVELVDDGVEELLREIKRVNEQEPAWGVLGNAGSTLDHRLAIRISDKYVVNQRPPVALPVRVSALDENFLIMKRAANLAVSRDLSGFHHYGNDICIIADILGWTSHVIDFHLLHKGAGAMGKAFVDSRRSIMGKYRRAFRARIIGGTLQRGYRIGGTAASRHVAGAILFGFRYFGSILHLLGRRSRYDALGG